MKNKIISYTKDYTIEDGFIIPQEAYRSIVSSHTRRFHNCLYLLANLNTCARNLIDFLTENMDKDNIVYSNKNTKDRFIDFIHNASGGRITYGESSIKKAYSSLCSTAILRKISRGIYKVNPQFFIKNSDESRGEMIKIELEFREGLDTKLTIAKGNTTREIQPYIEENDEK